MMSAEQELLVSEDGHWCWDGKEWRPHADGGHRILWRADRPRAAMTARPPRRHRPSLRLIDLAAADAGGESSLGKVPGSLRGLFDRVGVGVGSRRVASGRSELDRTRWRERIRTEIAEPPARIAVAGAKGGVGKTTISLALAAALGRLRFSRIVAYETHHVGSYRTRLSLRQKGALPELLELIRRVHNPLEIGLPTINRCVAHSPEDRFAVLSASHDPTAGGVLGEPEHRRLLRLLYRYFEIVIADLDPALLHSGTAYWLRRVADQVVVVSSTTAAGVELADSTIDYLETSRGPEWVRERALVVINAVRDEGSETRAIEDRLGQRAARVHRIPWDPHLERGGLFAWDTLGERTRDACLSLAASLGSGFALGQSPGGEPASQEAVPGLSVTGRRSQVEALPCSRSE